jgi:cyanophycinase
MPRGPLFLVGGNEFMPGNEPHDRRFVEAARSGPAYVVATAAVRQDPDRAVRTATSWFSTLGLHVTELPLRSRRAAADAHLADAAERAGGFYLCGGDPGLVVRTLQATPAWEAIVGAWRRGAALAGSSAGAMALGEWTLLRARHPGHSRRRFAPALGLANGLAVVPHLDEFGESWLPSVVEARPRRDAVLLGIDARTAAAWLPGSGRGWTATGVGHVDVITRDARRRVAAGHRIVGLRPPG